MKKRGGFLFLGGEMTVRADEVVGIFDIEECSVSRTTVNFLTACQKNGDIANVSENMPKSFIVTVDGTYISNVSPATINKRARQNKI